MKTSKPYSNDAQEGEKPTGPVFGTLRIARVTYDHHPIHAGGTSTIGEMVDAHIAKTIEAGNMVSEVSLMFETAEQQHQLAAIYRERNGLLYPGSR